MPAPTLEGGTGLRPGRPPSLLWAMRFDAYGCGHIVDVAVDAPDPGAFGEGFLWLHFELGTAELDGAIGQGQLGRSGWRRWPPGHVDLLRLQASATVSHSP